MATAKQKFTKDAELVLFVHNPQTQRLGRWSATKRQKKSKAFIVTESEIIRWH
jgi:hypothetical protein